MRTKTQVEGLFRRLYRDLGNDSAELIQIKPIDGGWDNALSYEVTRRDGKRTSIYRRELDDDNTENIRASLRAFS
ncbi:MAG: hypothetical protein HY278_05865 [candidate division NC10 bacterium]|nr:hypothetical protein [candidate division NC10 bacterium]